MSSAKDELKEAFDKDTRSLCKYGVRCYQKNEVHRKKFKHPPVVDQKKIYHETKNKKRTWLDRKEEAAEKSGSSDDDSDVELPEAKKSCVSPEPSEKNKDPDSPAVEDKSEETEIEEPGSPLAGRSEIKTEEEDEPEGKIEEDYCEEPPSTFVDERKIIKDRFLVTMPEDFYQFYELCTEILPANPSAAFKAANLLLVGPYDVLNGKISNSESKFEDDQYLRHWRYFYDPPEFQTIIKGNDKEGLHFGYWRDDPKEEAIFIAKNSSNTDCKIKPVAETVFGAVDIYLDDKLKTATPFEKPKISSLRQRLKKFAKTNEIQMDKSTEKMRTRERQVVARTFHGAGIVVPYNKKTQLGYRELAATDANLKNIVNRIDEAKDEDERISNLTHLEEVERLATIAADECDFGTCLELGHDLFSSGSNHVQSTALRMFTTAYTLMNRLEFLKIINAHYDSRKEGSSLGIV